MADEKQAAVADPGIDYKARYQHQLELERVLRVRVRELEESVAEAAVDGHKLSDEIRTVGRELLDVDRRRIIANSGLEVAIEIIGAPHVNRYPKHKDYAAAKCQTCMKLRRLNRDLVQSSRPESRMALAS